MAVATLAKPDTFRIERSTRIKADPAVVFALINDFRQWTVWSPWEKLDPNIARTYAGPDMGVGAVYAYESRKAGAGRMEILTAEADARIVIQLDFLKPMKARNTAEFSLERFGESTKLTWAMTGPKTTFSRLMDLVFNMDKTIGRDFEKGLADLKAAAENA